MPEHTPAPTYARSLYGFFLYILSKIVLIIYCVWAFCPDSLLHYFNIHYYPQKYWSFAVPLQLLLALTLFAFFIYPSINLLLSVNINNNRTITDSYSIRQAEYSVDNIPSSSKTCICKNKKKCIKDDYSVACENEGIIPHVQDLDIRLVCNKLY